MNTLGQKIKLLRTAKELTQEMLANLLSVNRATLASWEIDRALPDIETCKKLATFFKISLDELLDAGEEYNMNTPSNSPIFSAIHKIFKETESFGIHSIDLELSQENREQNKPPDIHEKIDLLEEEDRKALEILTDSLIRKKNPPGDDENAATGE